MILELATALYVELLLVNRRAEDVDYSLLKVVAQAS